jgi:hypothetical protein
MVGVVAWDGMEWRGVGVSHGWQWGRLTVMRRSVERPAVIFVCLFRNSCRLPCLVMLYEVAVSCFPFSIVMCRTGDHFTVSSGN